eukprot:633048-Hanusia_phi.AAC.1
MTTGHARPPSTLVDKMTWKLPGGSCGAVSMSSRRVKEGTEGRSEERTACGEVEKAGAILNTSERRKKKLDVRQSMFTM